jgi:glycosyltransferase involved in cell wall biosynthesis
MNTSFISTCFNEGENVSILLDSLLEQAKLPNEIIIVDAKSTDQTFSEIEKFKKIFNKKYPKIKFQLFQKEGNRSVGRNLAIKKSTGQIIAVSDFGCILDKKWLENLTKPFQKKDIDAVAGFYKAKTSSVFEKCLATYTCVMEERLDNNFLPSSRSVAFKKAAWDKIGGYPENLDTCEDLVFARNLKKAGFNFVVLKKAIVYWPQKKNIWQAFFQFFNYAKGDGQALYIRKTTPFLFLRYLAGFVLIFLFILLKQTFLLITVFWLLFFYFIWSINKNYKYVNSWMSFVYLPLLQVVSDVAVIIGMSFGTIKRIF